MDTGGQQGIGRQGSAQGWLERSGAVAAGWAEATHLIRHHLSSNWKIMSAGRSHAASDDAARRVSS